MIHISQGDYESINIESLIRCLMLLDQKSIDQLILYVHEDILTNELKNLSLTFSIKNNLLNTSFFNLKVNILKGDLKSSPNTALETAINNIDNGILYTLPLSKSSLNFKGEPCSGHTEYFRKMFNNTMQMLFRYENTDLLLLTDHIPLNKVSETITPNFFLNKAKPITDLFHYDEIIVLGINPHASENGTIGNDDLKIKTIVQDSGYKGPYPADTIHMHYKSNIRQLFISPYHDQGLIYFKRQFGILGIHLTIGLPFTRVSVDHGTAANLKHKKEAQISSFLNVLRYSLEEDLKAQAKA